MAVNLIQPTNFDGTLPVTFTWNSDDGSYCWDNFINFTNQAGTAIASSGNFNPNGADSTYTLSSAPEGTTSIGFEISCNPQNTLTGQLTLVAEENNSPENSGGNVGENNGQTSETVVVEFPENIDLSLGTQLTSEDRTAIAEAILLMFGTAFAVAMIVKTMRR